MKLGIFSALAMSAMVMVSCNNAPKEETVETTTETVETSTPATYVAAENSQVEWKGEVAGVYGHHGYVNLKSGNFELAEGNIVGGEFVVDMSEIFPTDSAYKFDEKSNPANLAAHLSNEDFFNTSEYPTATFVVTSVEGNKVMGDLTVRGKTNPETLEISTLEENGDDVTLVGKLVFNRQNYDVAWVHFMKDMVLSDDIEITFSLNAKKS